MTFLEDAADGPAAQHLYDADVAGGGYVMSLTRVWAHQPAAREAYDRLIGVVADGLSLRERGVLVAATAAARGDSYCALAWGARLAGATTPAVAAGVLTGTDDGLEPAERALARWARTVVADPSGTTAADVRALRAVGYTDEQVVAITVFIAARLAFSTVNAALGAAPDAELDVPPEVRDVVTWGREPGPQR